MVVILSRWQAVMFVVFLAMVFAKGGRTRRRSGR
jgi:hypothetical protein